MVIKENSKKKIKIIAMECMRSKQGLFSFKMVGTRLCLLDQRKYVLESKMLKMQQTKGLEMHRSKKADVEGFDLDQSSVFLIVMERGGSRFLNMVAKLSSSYGLVYSV